MTDQVFCYHCQTKHPREEMRLLVTKTGKRWRCIKSIQAAKADRASREAFGLRMTEANKSEAKSKIRHLHEMQHGMKV